MITIPAWYLCLIPLASVAVLFLMVMLFGVWRIQTPNE